MPDMRSIRSHLEDIVSGAVHAAVAAGDLPDVAVPDDVIERPKDPDHGDFASTLALRMARAAMRSPREIAETIVRHLPEDDVVQPAEIAGPGFINFRLADAFVQQQVDHVIENGPAFADITFGGGKKVQVEFVSANPTGPLHVGNARGAALGDTLASILGAAGYDVQREYYVNDAGTQAEIFGETLYVRYQQLFGRQVEVPPDGYPGEYMVGLARQLKDEAGDAYLRPEGEAAPPELATEGIARMIASIRRSLEAFGVHYDQWYSERSLFAPEGHYEKALAILRENTYLAEREGALWFASSNLGEAKDNVVVRSDGRPTYFASDIAYHYEKFLVRGFSLVVDVWGADHHGHVSRLKAAVGALGANPEALHVLLYQLVTLKRGGEAVRLSKRGGEIITIDDLIEEVGKDAARFFFLQRSPGAQMDFDLDLAAKQSNENPVYYVQYAHARLCSILDRAADQDLSPDGGDVSLLREPHELTLVREIMRLPEVIELAATRLETQDLPQYAMALASAFTAFNDAPRQRDDPSLRVIVDDRDLARARLRLVLATRIALARVLELMGMNAPERM